jgi:hypothetical protein
VSTHQKSSNYTFQLMLKYPVPVFTILIIVPCLRSVNLVDLAADGDHETVENILKKGWEDVNQLNKYNSTALILASCFGRFNVVEILIKHKADLELRDRFGFTAMVWAVRNGHYRIADLLSTAGADLFRDLQRVEVQFSIFDLFSKYDDYVNEKHSFGELLSYVNILPGENVPVEAIRVFVGR